MMVAWEVNRLAVATRSISSAMKGYAGSRKLFRLRVL